MRFTFPLEGRFTLAFKAFTEKERQVFFIAMGVLAGTTLVLLIAVNRAFMVEVPAYGGTLTEGMLNTPTHINPLLASGEIGTESDRDLTTLVYSGLLRRESENTYIPDLADHYTVSDDGLVYTFVLKPNLTWHDGKPINADDVVFTIKTAQDGRIKSPKRASWDGVGVEKVDDLTVTFTLKKPYAPFLENATMGILPKHIWEGVDYNRFDTNKYNREPIGSGPYMFDSMETTTKDGDEVPVSYTLKAFKHFALGKPYIKTITARFYRNEDELEKALRAGKVETVNGLSPDRAKVLSEENYRVEHAPLPRVLGVFLNQNQNPIFADAAVRKALDLTIDKQAIIDKVLASYGVLIDDPLPPGTLGYQEAGTPKDHDERIALAKKTLEKAGWSFDDASQMWIKKSKKETTKLAFSLATGEALELKSVADELKKDWAELGVPVEIRVFSTGDLKETVVRPRKFDALFFGQVIGRDSDPYAFWHSSQRIDPGLNIASYTNAAVDKLLEKARTEMDREKRIKLYQDFAEDVSNDYGALFIYAPEFLYIVPEKVHGLSLDSITLPSDRFLNSYTWYIETDSVWKIFVNK